MTLADLQLVFKNIWWNDNYCLVIIINHIYVEGCSALVMLALQPLPSPTLSELDPSADVPSDAELSLPTEGEVDRSAVVGSDMLSDTGLPSPMGCDSDPSEVADSSV